MAKPRHGTYPPVRLNRSWPGLRYRSQGFFKTLKRDGIWWLIDPNGMGFFIVGTDHVNFMGHPCEKLGYSPYYRNCREMYGGIEAWSEKTVNRLLSWGFNTLAWGHSPSLRYRGLAHIQHMEMGASFAKSEDICPPTTWTGFPDVFSPNFPRHCEDIARQICGPNVTDPWLVGYFIDNELEWFGKSRKETGLLEETVKKDPEHPAKKRLLQLICDKYRKVDSFNEAWALGLRDFEGFLHLESFGDLNQAIAEDAKEYLAIVAERYFAVTTSAIRKYDPNHLVLGCRFGQGAPRNVWEMAGRYCDVVSVNCYRTLDLEKGVMTDGFEEDLREWHSLARKPLMITEWSFPALDAGLPCSHGAGQRVPTQANRARAFAIFQKLLFSTPFIVGSDYFMWVDEPALGISSTFPEDSNYGLVNERDEPYVELTRAASQLNPMVYDIHSGTRKSD